MKKGLISIGILAGFVLSLLLVSGAFAQEKEYLMKVGYGDVKFTHQKHAETYKISCEKCHHELKGKKPGTAAQGCKKCHKAKAEGKTLGTKDAYHNSCKTCHDDAKKASKPAGPTGCTQCHVKAKK
jgi:hypothetical protein